MTSQLSQLERQVYLYLIDFLTEHTYQPSVRDIARHFSIKSTKTVWQILQSLSKKGYVRRDAARSRGLELEGLSGGLAVLPLPVYARLATERPAIRDEYRAGHVTFERRFVPNDDVFVIRVDADAANGADGIVSGDYLMIDPHSPAQDGAPVLARIGADTRVGKIAHRGRHTVLLSGAAEQKEIVADPTTDFEIVGVVCGVFRTLQDTATKNA